MGRIDHIPPLTNNGETAWFALEDNAVLLNGTCAAGFSQGKLFVKDGGFLTPLYISSQSGYTSASFKIGSPIYMYNENNSIVAQTAVTELKGYTSFYKVPLDANGVDIADQSFSDMFSNNNDVFVKVNLNADKTRWTPTRICGTAFLSQGDFAIRLGSYTGDLNSLTTAGLNKFMLEDNNPLFYMSADGLIPFENYLISTQGGSVDLDGFGYGTCTSTAAAKAVSLSGYSLERGFVSVYFTHAVQANATMDIESQGAKNIYAYGAAIKAGMIQSYDIATFYYDGVKYNLVGVYHSDQVMIKKELPTVTLSNDGGEGLLIDASGNNAWTEFLTLLPGKYKVTVRRNVKTSNDKMTSHNVMVSLKYRPNSESSNGTPITCANVPLIPVNGQIGVNTIEMTGFFNLYGTVPSAFCLDLDHFGLTGDQFGGNTPYIGGVNIGEWGNTDYIMFERIANNEPVE